MPYDPNAPDTNLELQASDDVFRADKTFLKNGLEREHYFDGTETAGAGGDHLVHRQGSGRVFVFTGGTPLNAGTLASGYSLAKARNTGIHVLDKQAGVVWYCWDGAADGWIDLSKVSGALAVAGALTVGGAATVTGLSTLSGDVQMATGKKLKVIAGEAFVQDSGAVTMNPFTHGVTRHQVTGSEGSWVGALDRLRGLLVGAPKTASSTTPSALTGSFVTKVSTTYDLTGRTQNSRIVLAGQITFEQAGASNSAEVEARITVNGAPSVLAPFARCGLPNRVNAQMIYQSALLLDWFDVAPATNFAYGIQARVASGTGNFFQGYLHLFDFGEVS